MSKNKDAIKINFGGLTKKLANDCNQDDPISSSIYTRSTLKPFSDLPVFEEEAQVDDIADVLPVLFLDDNEMLRFIDNKGVMHHVFIDDNDQPNYVESSMIYEVKDGETYEEVLGRGDEFLMQYTAVIDSRRLPEETKKLNVIFRNNLNGGMH